MPFDRGRWPTQIEAVCCLMESEFPGNRLDCAIVMKGAHGEFRSVEDRRRYLADRVRNRACTFSLNNHRSCEAASLQEGSTSLAQMGIGGKRYAYDEDGHYTLMVWMPPRQPDASYQRLTQAILAALGPDCRLLG